MKTTLIIDDGIMRHLKQEAARQRQTISYLVESALRNFLSPSSNKKLKLPPLPSWNMGEPLVDIADRDALYEVMEST